LVMQMTDEEKRQKDIMDQKAVEYYAATVEAWYGTRFEHDKSLLTLSAGGIGLLVTLLTTVGVTSAEALILYVVSLLSFALCLIIVLVIFRQNARYLEETVGGKAKSSDPFLAVLDNAAILSFTFGVILTVIIGTSSALNSYSDKAEKMTNKPVVVSVRDSINGIMKMQPSTDLQRSFNGSSKMEQGSAQSSTEQTSTQQTSASVSPAQGEKKE